MSYSSLTSEVEWEVAAQRTNNSSNFTWGETLNILNAKANT
jgi:formylglycine-generating enzyme required for sulfatase activity